MLSHGVTQHQRYILVSERGLGASCLDLLDDLVEKLACRQRLDVSDVVVLDRLVVKFALSWRLQSQTLLEGSRAVHMILVPAIKAHMEEWESQDLSDCAALCVASAIRRKELSFSLDGAI